MGGRSKAPHGEKVKGTSWAKAEGQPMSTRPRASEGQNVKGN